MSKRPFPWGRTFVIGFGFFGISIIWPIFNQFIPIFLQAGNPEFERQLLEAGRQVPNIQGFGMAPSLALFIMTWDNLFNMFLAPWVGARSDHTWNRFGRRKGWIILGAPIALLGFVFIPVAKTVLAISAFIVITDIGMALFRAPTVSWLGDLFTPEERSNANGVINLMGGLGALLAYFVGGLLFDKLGRSAPFIGGAIAMAVAVLVILFFVKEPRELPGGLPPKDSSTFDDLKMLFSAEDKSAIIVLVSVLLWFMGFNALETGLSSFAVFTLGMSAGKASLYAGSVSLAFLVFAMPSGFLGTKYGRERVIKLGLIGLFLSTLAGYFIIQNAISFVVILVLAGFLWSMINVNSLPLVYDHGDESRIGAYTGLYYLSSQLAAVLGPSLGGIVVDTFGDQYRWLWLFTALFMGLAWLTMRRIQPRAPQAAVA